MKCRLCGAEELQAFRVAALDYHECGRCSYIGLSPRHHPSHEAELARYRLHRNELSDPGYRRFLEVFLQKGVAPFLPRGGRVLDFGSGPVPALAALLEEGGWNCKPYDPFFAPGETWRRRQWDCIVLHEVAEHLRQPGRTLRALACRLIPGGLLAIRTRFRPISREAFATWWYREDPTHLGFFAPPCLRHFAAGSALEVVVIEEPDLALFRRPLLT
ncbi:MAG TPA: class I SAM-dependent methyltransferase [Rectinemataceae bacterium]|nr:class I SAM-dependent methyltransferase [Rectinemataceae bacterium]